MLPTLAQLPPTASAPTTTPELSNSEVLQLQLRLQQLGYYNESVDGAYGAKTKQALASFQRDSGLPPTGNIDPLTIQQLQNPKIFSIDPPASEATTAEPEVPDLLPTAASTAAEPAPSVQTAAASAPESVEADPPATPPAGRFSNLAWPILLLAGVVAVGGGIAFAYRQLRSGQLAKDSDRGYEAATASALTPDSLVEANSQNGARDQNQTHTAALEETTRLPKLDIVETLVAELQSSDPTSRRQAIWELGQRGNSSAVQPLVNLIIDADSKERSLILAALSEIGTRTLKPMNRALALSLQDENPEVRKNAIRDLTRIYDVAAQVSQMLSHVAEDEDPEVRETARWALGQLNRLRSLPGSEQRPSLYDSISPSDFLPGEKSNS
ncbi:MAG: peptidoglycan-binding protein [Leptolyngbyaceae cyanobacterium SM1_1_3]|nr:peptidoglycan-binding protein [Leptolyngbyaceae cyanobacterium SM1_1_3]NJN01684.1 peptidoglycan-binding protein [Leptolyngbyaceae cyanobacterium RM1_1_2]NJO11310.1 peptidoglycan-binding protein [Leptolyngbyaceae cyanobacterium SL_1_1]